MKTEVEEYWSVYYNSERNEHIIWYKAEIYERAASGWDNVKSSQKLLARIAFLKLKDQWKDDGFNPINLEGIPIETP